MPRPSTLLLLALVHGATAFMGGGKGSKGGCGVMAWYSQCKKDMSLLKDPSKIGSFCKTGCYTWMVKVRVRPHFERPGRRQALGRAL